MSRTILAIGAHLDDAFIGAGGVLLQAAKAGCRVVIVTVVSDFSTRVQTRGQETLTVKDLLALSEARGFEHRLLGYPYHQVDASDMGLKKELAAISVECRPDVAFIHHDQDHWPDHAACAKLGQDAVMFTHGLTADLTQRSCPLVYAFDLTPRQTYAFTPDVFYDVGDVLGEFMDLILAVDACAWRKDEGSSVTAEFRNVGPGNRPIRLSHHGLSRLGDCIRFGDLAGCRFALGFRTVWGDRRGPVLW